jgi:hypothetical protein
MDPTREAGAELLDAAESFFRQGRTSEAAREFRRALAAMRTSRMPGACCAPSWVWSVSLTPPWTAERWRSFRSSSMTGPSRHHRLLAHS